jgi:hypothetical protein
VAGANEISPTPTCKILSDAFHLVLLHYYSASASQHFRNNLITVAATREEVADWETAYYPTQLTSGMVGNGIGPRKTENEALLVDLAKGDDGSAAA